MILPNTSYYHCVLRSGHIVSRCPHRRQLATALYRKLAAAPLYRRKSTLTTFRSTPRPISSFQAASPVYYRCPLSTLHLLPLRRSRPPTLLQRIHNRPMSALLSPRRAMRTDLSILNQKFSILRPVRNGCGPLRSSAAIAAAIAGIRGMKVRSSVKKRCEGCRVRFFF